MVLQRDADQRTTRGVIQTLAAAEAGVGDNIFAEDRLAQARDVIENRPADGHPADMAFTDLDRPRGRGTGLVLLQEQESAFGLGKDPEQSVERPREHVFQLGGTPEVAADLQQGAKLLLGMDSDTRALGA